MTKVLWTTLYALTYTGSFFPHHDIDIVSSHKTFNKAKSSEQNRIKFAVQRYCP